MSIITSPRTQSMARMRMGASRTGSPRTTRALRWCGRASTRSRLASRAFELRRSLLQERLHAFALIFGPEERRERLRLELVGVGERHAFAAEDDALALRDGDGALARDLLGDVFHLGRELRVRHDGVHEADAQRF